MNRTTAAAAMVGALIAGTTPLTLLNIQDQNLKKETQAYVQELKQENAYLKCLDDNLKITLNWVEQEGVKTWYTAEGKVFTNKKVISAYEQTIERCERWSK